MNKSLLAENLPLQVQHAWYARYLGPARFRRFFKFGFVRNPWDRFYSAYRFLVKGGFTSGDPRFRDTVLRRYTSFADFAEQWLPQAYWVLFQGRVALDFVGRFENLARDYSRAARRLGVTKPLPPRQQRIGWKKLPRGLYPYGHCCGRSSIPTGPGAVRVHA